MNMQWYRSARTAAVCMLFALAGYVYANDQSQAPGVRVTLKGSMVCNGACIPDPKAQDHVMVVFAIDGTREIRAEVDRSILFFTGKVFTAIGRAS